MESYKNYTLAILNQDEYYFDFYFNDTNNPIPWTEIVKNENLWGICNLGYFRLADMSLQNNTKYKGKWIYGPSYQDYGLCIDKDGHISIQANAVDQATLKPIDDLYTFTSGCPPYVINGVDQNRQKFSKNGNIMIGTDKDNNVIIMMSPKDEGQTSDDGVEIMKNAGCVNVLRFDGSWSVHGRFGPGEVVQPSAMRKDAYYLAIYKKGYTPLRSDKKIFIDPGELPNGKPDEDLFNASINLQQKLLRNGIEAMISHYPGSSISEATKASISNCWKSDYLIAMDRANGDTSNIITIFTSADGDTAARNIIANKIKGKIKECLPTTVVEIQHNPADILRKANAAANNIIISDYFFENNKVDTIMDCIARTMVDYYGLSGYVIEKKETPLEKLQNAGYVAKCIAGSDNVSSNEMSNLLSKLGLLDSLI